MDRNGEDRGEFWDWGHKLLPENPREGKIIAGLVSVIGKPIPKVDKFNENESDLTLDPVGFQVDGENVVGLGLKGVGLEVLPRNIGNLASLRTLELSNNKLTSLPESLGQLQSLEILHLQYNQIGTFPNAITRLRSLHTLNLGTNKLISLPESIGNLTSLKVLYLQSNQLETLPEIIGKLESLEKLWIWKNNLTTLPKSIGNLRSLQQLYSHQNKLKELPDSIGNLALLKKLILGMNNLKTLPRTLWKLKNLILLSINDNPLDDEYSGLPREDVRTILEFCRKRATIDIFISHSIDDYNFFKIGEVAQFLEQQEEIHKVFYCEEDLVGNIDEWMLEAVPRCQLLLFFASKTSVYHSPDCRNELELADRHLIPAIPIKSDDVQWSELGELKIARELGLEFKKDRFGHFCQELYKYIYELKREIDLLDRDKRYSGISEIYERFRIECKDLESKLNKRISDLEQEMKSLKKRI